MGTLSAIPLTLRHLESSDYDSISPVIDNWWGGRPVSGLLPRLFFQHFRPTSFVIEENKEPVAFLVGFQSQSRPSVGYIHFVGVSPEFRHRGYGRKLYEKFFEVASSLGCTETQAITAPINEGSIRFHTQMGFQVVSGDGNVNGTSVFLNYAGAGQHRVLFRKSLSSS